MLDSNEKERYKRQLDILRWDQEMLKAATVLIAGVGGLGSASSTYLAAAGAGKIILVDDGMVELSNLNRQVLYTEVSLGAAKVDVARARLSALNSDIKIIPVKEKITAGNIAELAGDADLIIDGMDNQEGRLVINRHCVEHKVPFIYGAAQGWEGLVSVIIPPRTPCLACFRPDKPDGKIKPPHVAGITPGIVGLHQATEAIKLLMGIESGLTGKLLVIDSLSGEYDKIEIEKRTGCPVCS